MKTHHLVTVEQGWPFAGSYKFSHFNVADLNVTLTPAIHVFRCWSGDLCSSKRIAGMGLSGRSNPSCDRCGCADAICSPSRRCSSSQSRSCCCDMQEESQYPVNLVSLKSYILTDQWFICLLYWHTFSCLIDTFSCGDFFLKVRMVALL